MSFWESKTGGKITGDPDSAFIDDFSPMPEGTLALATVKRVETVEKPQTDYAEATSFIEFTYKIIDGDFKNREVKQKIKCFDGKPEQIDRNLNMLMLIMKLCNYKPTHSEQPTSQELNAMNGKVIGLRIGEWSMPKNDGSGTMDGNFVRECHSTKDFVCKTGVKKQFKQPVPSTNVDSAFSRNPVQFDDLNDDVPF